MSDSETSLLGSRLVELADQLAPSIDVAGQVDGARGRYRRIRRTRIALASAAVAVAVAAVGVTAAVGSLAGPSSGEVAGTSSSTTPSSVPAATTTRDRDEAVIDNALADQELDQADAERQFARSQPIADALAGRTPPLDLRAPALRGCPEATARLAELLGSPVTAGDGTDLVGGCAWSAGVLTLRISLAPEQAKEEMVREVDRSAVNDDCYPRAMPSTVELTALTLCPADVGTTWTLRVPDSTGAGYWSLSAEGGTAADPDAAAGGLLALVDLAAETW
ncbi:hypothetical protein ACI78T_06370 [Blastococcus sp. SYSU D00922]